MPDFILSPQNIKKPSVSLREKWFSGQLLVMKLWKKEKKQPTFSSVPCVEKKKLACFASVCRCDDTVPVQRNGAPLLDCQVGSVPKEGLELCCNSHHPLHRSLHSSQVVLQLSLLFAPRLLYQTPFQTSVLEHLLNAECQKAWRPSVRSWRAMLRCSTAARTAYTELDQSVRMRSMTGTPRWES